MSIISTWITQIIIFLIIGSIIELLLPNNSLKRYVNIIIGLLLLLMFTKPLFYLFSVDISKEINQMEHYLSDGDKQTNIDYSLDMQKTDIQSGQDAYILKEMKDQLVHIANPDVIESFNMNITDVTFIFTNQALDKYEHFEKVVVQLAYVDELSEEVGVELVSINTKETLDALEIKQVQAITHLLSEKWELAENKIELVIEGGTS